MLQETSDQNFASDIDRDKPVLVDFWAEWCGPCRILHPVLEEIADEESDFYIISLNIDDNPETARRYGVQSIPTMILFRSGEEELRMIGAQPKRKILDELRSVL